MMIEEVKIILLQRNSSLILRLDIFDINTKYLIKVREILENEKSIN